MIQAVLFDSDGLLVDTERLFFEATREAFAIDEAVISGSMGDLVFIGRQALSGDRRVTRYSIYSD